MRSLSLFLSLGIEGEIEFYMIVDVVLFTCCSSSVSLKTLKRFFILEN